MGIKDKHILKLSLQRFWPLGLMSAGLILMLVAFMYGALVVGVPYQDPTPEIQAGYERSADGVFKVFLGGMGVFALGFLARIMRIIMRWFRPRSVS